MLQKAMSPVEWEDLGRVFLKDGFLKYRWMILSAYRIMRHIVHFSNISGQKKIITTIAGGLDSGCYAYPALHWLL